MKERNFCFWFGLGLIIAFLQSFFLIRWPTIGWATLVSWRNDTPWLLYFLVGIVVDLFLIDLVGKTVLVFVIVGLLVNFVRSLLGRRKESQIKRLGSNF